MKSRTTQKAKEFGVQLAHMLLIQLIQCWCVHAYVSFYPRREGPYAMVARINHYAMPDKRKTNFSQIYITTAFDV